MIRHDIANSFCQLGRRNSARCGGMDQFQVMSLSNLKHPAQWDHHLHQSGNAVVQAQEYSFSSREIPFRRSEREKYEVGSCIWLIG